MNGRKNVCDNPFVSSIGFKIRHLKYTIEKKINEKNSNSAVDHLTTLSDVGYSSILPKLYCAISLQFMEEKI